MKTLFFKVLCVSISVVAFLGNLPALAVENLQIAMSAEPADGPALTVDFDADPQAQSVLIELYRQPDDNTCDLLAPGTLIASQKETIAAPHQQVPIPLEAGMQDGLYRISIHETVGKEETSVNSLFFLLKQGKIQEYSLEEWNMMCPLHPFQWLNDPRLLRAYSSDEGPCNLPKDPAKPGKKRCRLAVASLDVDLENIQKVIFLPTATDFPGYPTVSPTGSHIAYVATNVPGRLIIQEYPSSTIEARSIPIEGDVKMPHWSPDGKQLAFLANSTENPNYALWLTDIATGTVQQLTSQTNMTNILAWQGESGILVAERATPLVPGDAEEPGEPKIFEEAQFVLVDTQHPENRIQLPVDTTTMSFGKVLQLFAGTQRLVFVSNIDNEFDIRLKDKEKPSVFLTEDGYFDFDPSWIPGEDAIVFVSNRPVQ